MVSKCQIRSKVEIEQNNSQVATCISVDRLAYGASIVLVDKIDSVLIQCTLNTA